MPNVETKQYQNCHKDFTIASEDFDFYAKIKVPAPTFCPECRLVRRMHIRNERALYKGECKLCGQKTLTVYSPDKVFITYCHNCWWSDKWDVMNYGIEYDFTKPFFSQWRELLEKVPRLMLSVKDVVDSDYCNASENEKNCYLNTAGDHNERVMFSNRIVRNKDSLDLYVGIANELCYELVNCLQCYKLFFSRNCSQCSDSFFLLDCSNCSHCFGCVNLRNRQYSIFNEQCTEAFKIIEPELAFYRRMNLPLPRLCPNCRHYARLKQRNPLKLWTRQCMREGCPNTFQTSYAPDRPEIVYCEQCYLKEVV